MSKHRQYTPSKSIKDKISRWEGASMATNRSFEEEAADFNRVLPQYLKDSLSQKQLDALFSQSYNTGVNRWAKNILPSVEAYYGGAADSRQLRALTVHPKDKDPNYRGLRLRRNAEWNMFFDNIPLDDSYENNLLDTDFSDWYDVDSMYQQAYKEGDDLTTPISLDKIVQTKHEEDEKLLQRYNFINYLNAINNIKNGNYQNPLNLHIDSGVI